MAMIAQAVVAALTALPQESMNVTFGVESPAYVAIRAILSTSLVGLLGILSLHIVILPRMARQASAGARMLTQAVDRAALWWARALLWAIGASTVARLAAQHAAFFGTDAPWSRPTLAALLLNSSWGRGWWLALAATAFGLFAAHRIRRASTRGWPMLAAAAIALTASVAMAGHAAAASTPVMVIHALHVLGAGGWVGSLAALMLIAVPTVLRSGGDDRHSQIAALMRAFSPTALGFAGVLAATGTIAAWRNLGSVAELWQAAYGQLLLVKLALLSVAAGTGACNWKRVLPSLGNDASSAARLRVSAAVELVAALAILVVTAVLVATPMPGDG
jgi:putative copper export protein